MTKQRSRRRPAVSAIFGMILGIGITAAIAGTLIFVVQDQIGIATSGSSIQVSNLSVQRSDDKLSVTGTIKNTGSTSISEITINSISVSELSITQDDAHVLRVSGTHKDMPKVSELFCSVVVMNGSGTICGKLDTGIGFSIAVNPNLTTPTVTESILEGGRTKAFQLKIEASDLDPAATPHELDISDNVRISDNLTLILQFESGQDVLLSETYQARVRSG